MQKVNDSVHKVDTKPNMWNGVIARGQRSHCGQVFHHACSTYVQPSNQAMKDKKLIRKAQKSPKANYKTYKKNFKIEIFL